MKLAIHSPQKTLKPFLKQKPLRSEIDLFKSNLIALLDKINIVENQPTDESEEHLKNNIRDFLRDTYYKDTNAINTKDKKDLVIHLGKTTNTDVGVIIEAKRPSNRGEMLTADNPNKKALHELILYYLHERVTNNNSQLKQLVATNINEWFIIDANYFDKHIYRNSRIKKLYETKLNDNKDNPWFYEEVAKIVGRMEEEIPCVYFNLTLYDKILRNNNKEDDKELIALYKILTPQHLLKIATPNDSNSLDDKFYKELLHIIGLEEAKEGNKTIIRRKQENKNNASLIEMACRKLKTKGIHKINDLNSYGDTTEDQHFNIALELCITWINRILFLKLLEGQLVSYHKTENNKEAKEYTFLNIATIPDFDELFKLFHNVLAVNIQNREADIQSKYKLVPYLNSSLFEISELEDLTICIDSLDNHEKLPFFHNSVLKKNNKTASEKDGLILLDYLFRFLDAYDFASEGTVDIQEDSKGLINASVLGKVFEKINGYKDGSIYTPAFITMYMCRQSIRLAVIQKFNAVKGWKVKDFEELNRKIDDIDTDEANKIINDLKICDPAVGSGHFLVSALNEIIAIKSELKILQDRNGKRLKDYTVEVVNDELLIADDDYKLFEYKAQNPLRQGKSEIQRIQETLFYEKQTIIENCLFGVDINPNSVKICRLRLWIELLKNAYYKADTQYTELETLPNIDINIKCGNSLLSRFAIDADLSKALKSIKYDIKAYRGFVADYKSCKDRELKRNLQKIIDGIKGDFRTQIAMSDPRKKRLDKLVGELYHRFTGNMLFEEQVPYGKKEQKKADDEKKTLETEIEKLQNELDDVKANTIYKHAFEWRFEFPEVLNDNGDYEGFDVVIGNPPYIPLEAFSQSMRDFFRKKYKEVERKFDTSVLFILEGYKILNDNGSLSFIAPITWQTGENYSKLRKFFIEKFGIDYIINLPFNTFENAYVETSIYNFIKSELSEYRIFNFNKKEALLHE